MLDIDIQKRNFQNWLKATRKIGDQTLYAYTETILNKLKEIISLSDNQALKTLNFNMYSYQTLDAFDEFNSILRNDPNFDIVNKTGQAQSGWVSTPLNHYRNYLLQNENVKEDFTWIPFYREFANKLLEFENHRENLINIIKNVFSKTTNLALPTLERDNNIIDIDPFTVMGLFNKGITNDNRIELLSILKSSFGIKADLPKDFNGIPVLNNQKATFYYFIGDRNENDINNLWKLFQIALEYDKHNADLLKYSFNDVFNNVKQQKGIKWNITMGLFWIAPYAFINLDSRNREALLKTDLVSAEIKNKIKTFNDNLPTGEAYLQLCQKLSDELKNNKKQINNFPAFSYYAWKMQENENDNTLAKDKEVQMQTNIPLNQILYGPPGTGKTYNTIIEAVKIIEKDNPNYVNYDYSSNYQETKRRFEEYKTNGQVQFVTFHQSYSYEEFVEGIKPKTESGQIQYNVEDGIFKKICDDAKQIKADKVSNEIDFSITRIFKMSLGANWDNETENIYSYCLENNVVALGWGDDKDFSNCYTSEDFKNLDQTWGAKAVEIFKNWMRIGDIILISNGNSNIKAIAKITGEYEYHNDAEIRYCQFRKVEWLYSGDDIPVNKIYDKKLSQQTIYGFYLKDREGKENYNSTIKTEVLNEIITGTINEEKEKPYVLIIDEINRGNISKIFGELITLIEEDKRIGEKHELTVQLPYSQKSFGVPKNLYIIGTMNTSDRSIASIDIALRRRFKFKEIMPNCDIITEKVGDINLKEIFNNLNTKIKILLDRDHQIGHSYFVDVEDEEHLKQIWFDSIIPLLNEYFYGDWEKLKLVIPGFIKTEDIPKELQSECDEKKYYEFKTLKDIEGDDFKALLEQKVFKENNAE